MKRQILHIILISAISLCSNALFAQSNLHPSIFITNSEGRLISKSIQTSPLLAASLKEARSVADMGIKEKMDVPVPKDPAGGYTHERHKKNYLEMYNAGLAYVITGDKKYAEFVIRMLMKYAELIPMLKNHPESKDNTPGRLFWQPLNDANWMVYTSIAFDCVYDYASKTQRKEITDNVFLPMCRFMTVDLKPWFNLVHNHGVWACAAVGMAGFVIGDDNLVQEALYGSEKDGKSGFIAQLNQLFSPDGYYTEGPYYARYALLPFYIFAQALQNRMPQLKIFEHRKQILKKALYAALQQTNTNGSFFPINDNIKDKTYITSEMMIATDIAYKEYGKDSSLLSIAAKQNGVLLNGSGLLIANAIKHYNGHLPPFAYKSVEYTDGAAGNEGGISLLRSKNGEELATLLFKYASHGLSHGHYDELNMLFYDQGNEILGDYGSARFLNVEQKEGGRYLPENKGFAMQTIAHNTLTVDESSQFGGKEKTASQYHSSKWFSSLIGKVQVVSAKDSNAYPGVILQRTLFLVKKNDRPVCLDIFRVTSQTTHKYDLPFWYQGQFISTSFDYTPFTQIQKEWGTKNGYQYLWNQAEGTSVKGTGALTFLNGGSFYTITALTDSTTQLHMVMTGASDPNFNLRNEKGFIVRKQGKDQLFVNVIEPHGGFDPVRENSTGSRSAVQEIQEIINNGEQTVVKIVFKNSDVWTVMVANNDNHPSAKHNVTIKGIHFSWTGPFALYVNGNMMD